MIDFDIHTVLDVLSVEGHIRVRRPYSGPAGLSDTGHVGRRRLGRKRRYCNPPPRLIHFQLIIYGLEGSFLPTLVSIGDSVHQNGTTHTPSPVLLLQIVLDNSI